MADILVNPRDPHGSAYCPFNIKKERKENMNDMLVIGRLTA